MLMGILARLQIQRINAVIVIFEALYADRGHILNSLFDDYVGSENYSVETYSDTALFIKDYCESTVKILTNSVLDCKFALYIRFARITVVYDFIMLMAALFIKDYCESEHNEIYYPTTYYGKDTENRAYYSMTKGISIESLRWFDICENYGGL